MESHGSPLAASDGQDCRATMDGGSLNNFDDEWKESFPYAEEMNDR